MYNCVDYLQAIKVDYVQRCIRFNSKPARLQLKLVSSSRLAVRPHFNTFDSRIPDRHIDCALYIQRSSSVCSEARQSLTGAGRLTLDTLDSDTSRLPLLCLTLRKSLLHSARN